MKQFKHLVPAVFATMLWALAGGAAAGGVDQTSGQLQGVRQVEAEIYSAGQPDAAQLEDLAGQGLAAVINLRGAGESIGFDEAGLLDARGVAYHAIPITGAADLTRDNVSRLDAALAQHAGQPVLVHCASGNRVGALLALRAAWLGGADAEAALEIGRKAGMTRLEPAVRSLLQPDEDRGEP